MKLLFYLSFCSIYFGIIDGFEWLENTCVKTFNKTFPYDKKYINNIQKQEVERLLFENGYDTEIHSNNDMNLIMAAIANNYHITFH